MSTVPAAPPVPAPDPVDPATIATWPAHRAEVANRLASALGTVPTQRRALAYLDGLLGGAQRKNGWQLAEANGDADPYGIQYLLNRARWSVAEARTALCGYVQDHLGDAQAVGIIDETAFLKKGTLSAGVARQYSGTAGRVENCQVRVFLAYAGAQGYTLLDAELHLPQKAWTDQPARLQSVGLAPDTPFATKPQLAQRLLARAQAAGISLAWVVGDTVHGHSGKLRSWLEAQDQAYLLAVLLVGRYEYVVGEVYADLTEGDWQRLSAGPGSKGERWYDWQCLVLAEGANADKGYYLLFRRACGQPQKWQAYLVWGPPACDLSTLVRVAGSRWRIESAFELARQEVGLDEYEVRNARGWDRHMILALLSVVRAASLSPPVPQKKRAGSGSLAGDEIRCLLCGGGSYAGCGGCWLGRTGGATIGNSLNGNKYNCSIRSMCRIWLVALRTSYSSSPTPAWPPDGYTHDMPATPASVSRLYLCNCSGTPVLLA